MNTVFIVSRKKLKGNSRHVEYQEIEKYFRFKSSTFSLPRPFQNYCLQSLVLRAWRASQNDNGKSDRQFWAKPVVIKKTYNYNLDKIHYIRVHSSESAGHRRKAATGVIYTPPTVVTKSPRWLNCTGHRTQYRFSVSPARQVSSTSGVFKLSYVNL